MKFARFLKFLVLLPFAAGIGISFQNCSGNFKIDQPSLGSDLVVQNVSIPCSLQDGTKVQPGNSIQGFPMMSALYPLTCGSQIQRTCQENGLFDGPVPVFNSCSQMCMHPANGQAVSSGSTYVYYSKSMGSSLADCEASKITSTCQQSTGTFLPAISAQAFTSCSVQPQTCAYTSSTGTAIPTGNTVGSTVTGFQMQSATSPILCGQQVTRTCGADGSWGGIVPIYTACAQSCVHPVSGQPAISGSSYVYYSKSTGTSQADCDSARLTSTCQASTGVYLPTIPAQRFASCLVQNQICAYTSSTGTATPTGNVVGSTVTGFSLQAATYPTLCGQQVTRSCTTTGAWSGSVPVFTACAQSCVHPTNGQAVTSGSTYVYYSKSTGTSQADCDSARLTSTCQASSGTYLPTIPTQRFATCSVQAPVACSYPSSTGTATPTGTAVGSTVTGFPLQSATYPMLCGQQVTRSCTTTGAWSGGVPLYTACGQKCVHPDSGQPVNLNTAYIYYTLSQGSAAACAAARVTSTCLATGLFSPAPAATRFTSCSEYPLPTVALVATPNTIQSSEVVTLSWNSANAVTLSLNPGAINVSGKTSHIVNPGTTTTYTLTATNPAGSASSSATVTVSGALMGQALYENKCASCHSAFATSNLKGRNITLDIITSAMSTKISAMKSLDGTLTTAQLNSIVALFPADPTGPVLSSNFACTSADEERKSSVDLIRLSGTELKNTYVSLVPAAVWSALASNHYLIPTDSLEGLISNFQGTYSSDMVDQMSRFNDLLASQMVASNANISAFFGSCATLTSFPKACFDTFLTAKGPSIFRSPLAANDNSAIWSTVSQATTVPDQLKTLTQVLFNDPRFIYHLELGEGNVDASGLYALTSYEIANRISYGMTAAPPDATLWADAVQNRLKDINVVSSHVDRIALTTAFKNRVIDFVKFYVGMQKTGLAPSQSDFLNGISGTNLDAAATEEFNEFVNYIVFTQKGTLKDLFSSKAAFPKTAALATILGTQTWSSGAPRSSPNHTGILTKPYMFLVSTPMLKLVQRGKKIRINMLCSDVPQPSATDLAARPMLSESDVINLTRRDYIDKATLANANCIVCHSKMNQLGYATGNYDSIGRFSTIEKVYNSSNVMVAEHPVVTTVRPTFTEVDSRVFANPIEFQAELAKTDVLQQCMTRKAFQYFQMKPELVAMDTCRLNKMDSLIKKDMPLFNFFLENFKQRSMLYKRSN